MEEVGNIEVQKVKFNRTSMYTFEKSSTTYVITHKTYLLILSLAYFLNKYMWVPPAYYLNFFLEVFCFLWRFNKYEKYQEILKRF